jgi:HD-GYP domain-containing protein (c-di-GMP phosphodiesterase class II)
VFSEGAPLDALESVDSRRYLPHALAVTAVVIVAPALVVIPLAPFAGIPDLLLSALLATGLSAAAGSVGSALWTRRPESREISFSDLLLWSWARRVSAERRFARAVARAHDDSRGPRAATRQTGDELAALRRLSVVFEARDAATHGHTGRVTRHAERIAERMGLSPREVAQVRAAASVHDVGKVKIPHSVLVREGELTPEQRALFERHPVDGAEKVAAAGAPEVAAIVRHHHERIDGTGYPDRLAGEEIPLGARIVAVADTFDRLAAPPDSGRPRFVSARNALDGLCARAGSQLDAAAVAAFVDYYSGKRAIAGVAFAATAPQRLVRWVAAAPAGIGASAPPLAQGVCAAGALALAGTCLTTLPPPGAGVRGDDRPPARAERAPGSAIVDASRSDRAAVTLDVAPARGERSGSRRDATRDDGGWPQGRSRDGGGGPGVERSPGSDGGSAPSRPPASAPSPGNAGDGPARPQASPAPEPAPTPPQPAASPAAKPPPPTTGPASPPPATPAPTAPPSPPPTTVLEPVLDQVHQVLDPLPTRQLTDPVERLLGNTLSP